MEYRTAVDSHIGITKDLTATHRVVMAATSAIDITHLSTTKTGLTNRSIADGHVRISA